MTGANFGTPATKLALSLATRPAQQFPITTPHQIKAGLHQTDRTVAQVVALPGPFGDTPDAKQALCDRAVTIALDPGVERAQHKSQSLSPLWRQVMKRGTSRSPVKRQPETLRGVAANLEITIKHQFGGVSRVRSRRLP